jgi:hypothetical protein
MEWSSEVGIRRRFAASPPPPIRPDQNEFDWISIATARPVLLFASGGEQWVPSNSFSRYPRIFATTSSFRMIINGRIKF